MALKVLVAEPDVELARQQKAALEDIPDLELIVKLFHDADAVDEAEKWRPDLVLLRHERPGKTGFAAMPRLRKSAAKDAAVIVTTADATPEAIEKHRASPTAADVVLPLPASRAQLLEAVRAAAPKAKAHQASRPAEDVAESGNPGPVTASGSRFQVLVAEVPSPPAKSDAATADAPAPARDSIPRPSFTGPRAPTATMAVDPTDLAFVERLFSSLGKLDALLETGDADPRVVQLRDKLRERERDLQRLARLWRSKEQEVRAADARMHEKESEVEGHQLQIRDLSDALATAKKALAEKDKELGASVDGLLTERVMLEKDLIEVVAGKEKEIEGLKRERRELENAAAALKQELVSRVFEWDQAYRELDSTLKRTVAHGQAVMEDVYERLDISRVDLLRRFDQVVEEQRRVAFLKLRQQEFRDQHVEAIRGADASRRELLHEIDNQDGYLRALRGELRDQAGRADGDTFLLQCQLHESQREKAAVQFRLNRTEAWLTQRLWERDEEIKRLHGLWTRDRGELAEVRARLNTQELHGEQVFFNMDQDLAVARSEAGALAWLRAQENAAHSQQVDDLQAKIHTLTDDVMNRDLRIEEANTAYATLAEEKARAELAGHTAVTEREARINELQAQLADAETRITAANEKRAGLERTLASREAAMKELSVKVDAQAEELSALQNTSAGHEANARSLSMRLDERERALRDRENALATSRGELGAAREEMDRQANEITSRDEQLRVKGLEIRNLEAAVSRKEAQIEELDGVRAHLQTQITRIEEEKDGLKSKIKELNNTVSQTQSQVTRLQAEVAALSDDKAGLQRTVADKQVALEGLEEMLQKADDDRKAQLQRQRGLEGQLEAERSEAARLRGELKERGADLDEKASELEAAAKERAELESQLQAKSAEIAEAESQAAELRSQIDDGAAQRTVLEGELEERAQHVARLDSRIEALLKELDEERGHVAQKVGERDDAQAKVTSLTHDVETTRAEVRRLETEVARLTDLVHASETTGTEQFSRLEEQGKRLAETQADLQRTSESLSKTENTLKTTETRLREREEQARTLGESVEQLQTSLAEKSTLADDLQRLLAEAESKEQVQGTELQSLRSEHEDLQEQLFASQDQVRQLDATVKRDEEQAEAAHRREMDLKEELRQAESRAAEELQVAESQAAKLREELSTVRGERDEANFSIAKLQDQVRSMELAQKEQEQVHASLGSRESALHKQNTELRSRVAQSEKSNAEMTLQLTELSEKVAELQGELEAGASARAVEADLRQKAQEERREAESTLKERVLELEAMQRKAEERQHEIERLEARLEGEKAAKSQLEATLAEQRDLAAQIQAETDVRGSQNSELERSRAQLTVKVGQLERRVQTLQEQLESSNAAKEAQVTEVKGKLTEVVQSHAAEKGELNKRLAELEAARVRAEGAVRQAQDEKENLKRLANRKLQQLTEQLKEAQAAAEAAQKASEATSQTVKELDTLREAERRARVERDAIRRESQTKVQNLQSRVDRLTRTLTEHRIPLPSMTAPPPEPRPAAPAADPAAAPAPAPAFMEDEEEDGRPVSKTPQ